MRKVVLLVAAGALALAVAAPPAMGSVDMEVFVEGKIKPTRGGTVSKPSGKFPLFTQVRSQKRGGGQGAPVRKTVLTYAAQFEFNGKRFKACSKSTLDNKGPAACPKGSQVGEGSVDALIGTEKVTLKVLVFNGPGGNKVELYVTPVLNTAIEGVLKGGKGKKKTVTFVVPKNAIEPAPGTFASLTRFGANVGTYKDPRTGKTVKATTKLGGKTIPYVETTGCTGGRLPISARFTFATQSEFPNLPENLRSNQASLTAANVIKCSR